MVVYTCNSGLQEVEVGGWWAQDESGLQSETLTDTHTRNSAYWSMCCNKTKFLKMLHTYLYLSF
jgi:hypothetical protein